MRRSALILAALSVSVALGGCSLDSSTTASSGSFTGTAAPVAVLLNRFSSDAGSTDESDICEHVLDSRLVTALSKFKGGCVTVITNQLKTVDDTTLTVESIKVKPSGKTATASVQTVLNGKKVLRTVLLVKQPAGWRLDSIQ